MAESKPKKRDAQSPLAGDEEDLKRRIIEQDAPILVNLDDISDGEETSDTESDLTAFLRQESDNGPDPDSTMAKKVDSLIGRMDRFMNCFATLHATVTNNQRSNDRKFKSLETAHNDFAVKMTDSTTSNRSRIELLESELRESKANNSALLTRITEIEEKQSRSHSQQRQVNEQHSKSIKDLKIEQGFTNKSVNDCFSEVKERKVIISGVPEFPGENTTVVALGCINKIIGAAINSKHPDVHPDGLNKLRYESLDKAFRIGRAGKNRNRNISVTFMRGSDKDMVYTAKAGLKEEDGIKFYLNDDASAEGRTLKAKLKRIVTVAKEQGRTAKLSGNKVIIDSRLYASNQLNLLPKDIINNLKQEKEIDDGIVYRGEMSTFSNFAPAPFALDNSEFAHVEQYYQYTKAVHHEDSETADTIMALSDPLRIKALGDGIEGNSAWMERRMLVLYEGVRAKFEQNLPLQEELLSTDGKHLYEATTDSYFGCGIGYDSKRWQLKDWGGENVAGLVLRKVRDELLGIPPEENENNNTLTEIASQSEVDSETDMEASNCAEEDNHASYENAQKSTQHADDRPPPEYYRDGPGESGLAGASQSYYQGLSNSGHSRGRTRARGKGRGNGPRGNSHHGNKLSNSCMSAADRNFLGIKEKQIIRHKNDKRSRNDKNTTSPKSNRKVWATLTLEQKKGLEALGLTPEIYST